MISQTIKLVIAEPVFSQALPARSSDNIDMKNVDTAIEEFATNIVAKESHDLFGETRDLISIFFLNIQEISLLLL